MKIILISGHAQNGKDTCAGMFKKSIESKGKLALIVHYADLLKFICKSFFGWNGEKDEAGRTLLQRVGTDVVRVKAPNYWRDFVYSVLDLFPNEWDYVIIPDARFENEIERVSKYPTYHVRVERVNFESPLTAEQQAHISETALDNCRPDFLIKNDTLDHLNQQVTSIFNFLEQY